MDDHGSICASNSSTNASTVLDHHLEDVRVDVVKCSVGVTAFLLVLPFVLFHFKRFPIGATGAVLAGATLTILTQTISQHEAYEVIGAPENTRTICLLLGMMILAQYFERELLAERLLSRILKAEGSFAVYLLAVTAFDFLLSAVLTNDVACVALTPLILADWNKRKGPKPTGEISVLLLGIATSANIGSSSTIFGNPQMALIASKTSQPLFDQSRLDMRRCIFYLWLPAVLCFGVNYAFLLVYAWFLKKLDGRRKRKAGHDEKTYGKVGKEVHVVGLEKNGAHEGPGSQASAAVNAKQARVRSLSTASSAIAARMDNQDIDDWTPSNSKVFQAILCLGLILIVVLFLISNERLHFDMGKGFKEAASLVHCLRLRFCRLGTHGCRHHRHMRGRPDQQARAVGGPDKGRLVRATHVLRHVRLAVRLEQDERAAVYLESTTCCRDHEAIQDHSVLLGFLRLYPDLLKHF